MPNKGYFIQQMTRRGAGTLFDEGRGKDKEVISNVNDFSRKKSRLLSKAGGSEKQLFYILYIDYLNRITAGRIGRRLRRFHFCHLRCSSTRFVPHLKPFSGPANQSLFTHTRPS